MSYKVDRKGATPDWADRVLVIWEEDDAMVPDRERAEEALLRISGLYGGVTAFRDKPVASIDEGDTTYSLFPGGWVRGCCCGLGFVGVLVVDEKPAPLPSSAFDEEGDMG